MSVMTMLAHINAVSVPLTAVSNAVNAASIFFTIIDAPKPATGGIRDAEVSLDHDINIEDMNFAYPTRHEVRILNNLSLTIPNGAITAIVGASGSGKSTIVALIQRWYELGDPDPITSYLRNGSIKLGATNLNKIDLHWWRAQIGMVQQDSFLFNDTIFKNVEYGLVGTEWEDALDEEKKRLVEQACKEAYADEFIRSLPMVRGQFSEIQRTLLIWGRRTRHKSATWVSNSAAGNDSESLLPAPSSAVRSC
jgi:ABC-type multidrug transport system fused ATPase/permease subunit